MQSRRVVYWLLKRRESVRCSWAIATGTILDWVVATIPEWVTRGGGAKIVVRDDNVVAGFCVHIRRAENLFRGLGGRDG